MRYLAETHTEQGSRNSRFLKYAWLFCNYFRKNSYHECLIETSNSICRVNQMTGFYMERNTWLK